MSLLISFVDEDNLQAINWDLKFMNLLIMTGRNETSILLLRSLPLMS